MEFGIFNLMGARDAGTTAAQVFNEVAEQTKLADQDRKSTRLNSSHSQQSRMPSSA